MTKEEQIELGKQLIAEMRAAFARNDWDATTSAYEQMEGIKTNRAINLEATHAWRSAPLSPPRKGVPRASCSRGSRRGNTRSLPTMSSWRVPISTSRNTKTPLRPANVQRNCASPN